MPAIKRLLSARGLFSLRLVKTQPDVRLCYELHIEK